MEIINCKYLFLKSYFAIHWWFSGVVLFFLIAYTFSKIVVFSKAVYDLEEWKWRVFCWWGSRELQHSLPFWDLVTSVVYLRNFTSVFPSAVLVGLLWHLCLGIVDSPAKCLVISLHRRSPLSTLYQPEINHANNRAQPLKSKCLH